MQRFLIITSSTSLAITWEAREQYVRDFCAQLEARLEDVQVLYTSYDDISYLVHNGTVCVRDERHQLDLRDVDLVHFKNWAQATGHAAVVADYLAHHRVKFFNTEVNANQILGKLAQMCHLALHGLLAPDTYFASKARLHQLFVDKQLPSGFSFPLIIKADQASRGAHNYLAANHQEALDILVAADLEREFIIQNFIPNNGDYRVLFIGTNMEPLIFHRSAVPGSHLNNTSQGGQGTFIDSSTLPQHYLPMARQAAVLLGREICGVDLLVDKRTNEVCILEVNPTPALATGFGVDEKTTKFANFLQHQLAQQAVPLASEKTVIGRAETIQLVDHGPLTVVAKVDTGADISSLGVSDVTERGGRLSFKLFHPDHPEYSGQIITLASGDFSKTRIANSFGQRELRYVVKLRVKLAGRLLRGTFSLADRSQKLYPVLLGRRLLKGKFVVDVSAGEPLHTAEKARRQKLQLDLDESDDRLGTA